MAVIETSRARGSSAIARFFRKIMGRDGRWHYHLPLFKGAKMRRWDDATGRFEYRDLTPEEHLDDFEGGI